MERRAERRRQRSARQNCAPELRAELRGGGARLHRILDALHLAEHLEDALVARLELGVVRLRRPLPLHLHRRRLLRPPPAVLIMLPSASMPPSPSRRRRRWRRAAAGPTRSRPSSCCSSTAAVLARQHPPPAAACPAATPGITGFTAARSRPLWPTPRTAGRRGGSTVLPRRLALVVKVVRAPVRRRPSPSTPAPARPRPRPSGRPCARSSAARGRGGCRATGRPGARAS